MTDSLREDEAKEEIRQGKYDFWAGRPCPHAPGTRAANNWNQGFSAELRSSAQRAEGVLGGDK